LRSVVEALRDSPEFLAGWLANTPGGDTWLASQLGLDEARLERLLLCRSPRPSFFPADVQSIAAFVEVDSDSLAWTLRVGAALTTLAAGPLVGANIADDVPEGVLAAARDATSETISRGNVGGAHIRRLADDVRARAPRRGKAALDVESLVAWTAPLAVVVLPELNIAGARGWLAERGAGVQFGKDDRQLRGLLLAWRGSGVIFVDGGLPVPDRRFTVAHELGHFLLDYVEPRARVLRKAPDLLEVLDGHRPVTARDRTRAVLERISLGVHAHLLDRDPHGGAAWDVEQGEDLSSRFALELLSPWRDVLATLRRLPDGLVWGGRLEAATRLLEGTFELPEQAARVRARAALESMGEGPGFLER
jgi:hypothetical protein